MAAGGPSIRETKYSKVAKENLEDKLGEWKSKKNRDVIYVLHNSDLSSFEIENKAYKIGLVVKISKMKGTQFLSTIRFRHELS